MLHVFVLQLFRQILIIIPYYMSISKNTAHEPAHVGAYQCCCDPSTNCNPPTTPCNGMSITVDVLTDNYPKETSWTLTNTCTGQTQELVGVNTLYTTKATEYSDKYCVPPARYTFQISDSAGDGICCGYGEGSYEVTLDGVSVASGGQFGGSATSSAFGLCTGTTPPPTVSVNA